MKSKIQAVALVYAIAMTFGVASRTAQANDEGPCKQIKEACETAGFTKGQAKEGNGLWVDCIDPIMSGTAQPKKATKPLPTVDAQVVAACKAKHPKFGQHHGK
jgi:hypothetical protein